MNKTINQNNSVSDDFVLLKIKKIKRNLLIISSVIFLALFLFGVIFRRYYYNFFYGPFYKNFQDLNAIDDVNSLKEYFVTVEGTDLYETGVFYTESDGNKEVVVSNCYLLRIEDKFLVVKLPKAKDLSYSFSGKLKKMPDDLLTALKESYMESEIYTGEFENVFFPFMLDATSFRVDGVVGFMFCAIPFFIMLKNIFKIILYTLNPKIHPAYKSLRKYGDIDEVISDIKNELLTETNEKYLNTTITKSWLIAEEFSNLKIYKLKDIIWVFKTINTQNGNIPVSCKLNLKFYNKESLDIYFKTNEELLNAAISSILDKVPWAVYGYSIEYYNMWSKNYEDFIRMVEDNKREMEIKNNE